MSVRAWAAARGIDLDHLDRERRHAEVAALGRHLMAEVGRLIPVLPVPLVATVLLREPQRPLSLFDLKSAVAALVARLEAGGARLYVPRQDWDYAVGAGLRMLTLRHLVDEVDGLYSARAGELTLVALLRQLDRASAVAPCRADPVVQAPQLRRWSAVANSRR